MSFMEFTGEVHQDKYKNFTFGMRIKDDIKKKEIVLIGDPTYDHLFKKVFLEDSSLVENLLNSIFFVGDEKIQNVHYLPNDQYGYAPHEKGSKRLDVLIEGDIKEYPKTNIQNIIVGIEMQIGHKLSQKDIERFTDYLIRIYNKSKNPPVKAYVIVLMIHPYDDVFKNSKTAKTCFITKTIPKSIEKNVNDKCAI